MWIPSVCLLVSFWRRHATCKGPCTPCPRSRVNSPCVPLTPAEGGMRSLATHSLSPPSHLCCTVGARSFSDLQPKSRCLYLPLPTNPMLSTEGKFILRSEGSPDQWPCLPLPGHQFRIPMTWHSQAVRTGFWSEYKADPEGVGDFVRTPLENHLMSYFIYLFF